MVIANERLSPASAGAVPVALGTLVSITVTLRNTADVSSMGISTMNTFIIGSRSSSPSPMCFLRRPVLRMLGRHVVARAALVQGLDQARAAGIDGVENRLHLAGQETVDEKRRNGNQKTERRRVHGLRNTGGEERSALRGIRRTHRGERGDESEDGAQQSQQRARVGKHGEIVEAS